MRNPPKIDSEERELYLVARVEAPQTARREETLKNLLEALQDQRRTLGEEESMAAAAQFASNAPKRELSSGTLANLGRPPRWSKAVAVAIPLTLAAAATWLLLNSWDKIRVELNPESVAHHSKSSVPIPTTTSSAQETKRELSGGIERRGHSPALRAAKRPSPSLVSEIELLDRARAALSSGSPEDALRRLDEFERELHGVRMTDEATLLKISALRRVGRVAESRELALTFIDDHPNSPLVERARQLLGSIDERALNPKDGKLP